MMAGCVRHLSWHAHARSFGMCCTSLRPVEQHTTARSRENAPQKRLRMTPQKQQQRSSPLAAGFSTASTTAARDKEAQEAERDPSSATYPEPFSAYIHLPFCKKKCRYCDFPVIAVGMRPEVEKIQDSMKTYVDAVCREIIATKRLNTSGPLKTIFFGGGTPALIPPALLEQIVTTLDKAFGISLDAEISIECDPGTFTAPQLRSYRDLGITRVSVGVQAFDDELLTVCGRAHDLADVYRAIDSVYSANVASWSLDLMSGLPGLTEEGWERSLRAALDADPHHLSVYDLQIEEHTPFARQYRPGESPLPSEECAVTMFGTASQLLRGSGYDHYEISNYAKSEKHRCAHNMVYWTGLPYYAFGMGAASYMLGRRFSRPKRLNAYLKYLEELEGEVGGYGNLGAPVVPGSTLPEESVDDRLTDTIMLRLRLSEGLDLRQVAADYSNGGDVVKVIVSSLLEHEQRGHVVFGREEEEDSARRRGEGEISRVRLTDPDGFIVSNDVISDVFVALDDLKLA